MPSKKQKANLKRGPGDAETAARARAGQARKIARHREAQARVHRAAQADDVVAVVEEMFLAAARATLEEYRRFNAGGPDARLSPNLPALSRETRMLAERVEELGADPDAEARAWFERLEQTITCPDCGALMGTENALEPRPLVEPLGTKCVRHARDQ
jgi:hypothetical protein